MCLIDNPKGPEWGCAGLNPFILCSGQYPNGPCEREGIDPNKTLIGFSLAIDSSDSFLKRRTIYVCAKCCFRSGKATLS